MKKTIFLALFLFAATVCVFSQNGRIIEITGEVELKAANASAFSPASVGSIIAPNTIVSTGFRSTAVIEIGSSRITVRALTRLTLAEIQRAENTENINIDLQTGRVRVDVNPPAGSRTNMSVQSPSATASVRGTSFEMDTDRVIVNEGRVLFAGSNGPGVMVDAGNVSFSNADGSVADPAEVIISTLLPQPPVGAPSPETVTQSFDPTDGELVFVLTYK